MYVCMYVCVQDESMIVSRSMCESAVGFNA